VSPAEASAELLRPLVPVQCSGAILYHKESSGSPLAFAAERSAVTSSVASREAKPAEPDRPALPAEDLEKARPDAASLLQRARDLADQGQLDDAHRLCELALARDQLDPEAHLLMAAICQERGEVGTAVEALRRAIYLDPDSAPAHFLLGSLLLRQGEQRRGQRSMETAVGLLSSRPRDEVVPGTDGLSAGPLLEMARAYLELGR
jgi:Tfp pilus assembly protein PilF